MASNISGKTAFAPRHRRDRAMIAAVVFAIWLAMILGFGMDVVRRAQEGRLSFPLIIHLHAIAYTSWLLLLAGQVWLVRTGRVSVHRRVGPLALLLIPLMLVLGPAAVISQVSTNPYMPDRWIAWMSVQFTNAFGSAVLLAAGFLKRRDAAAHKRLMLMGTIAVTEPGFGRIWLLPLQARLGEGYVPFYFSAFIGTLLLVLAVGAYDLATRRRLHPAYVGAALWIFANEALADWLFYQPFWLAWMKALTGHGA
jgi:uncharacterized membrane protein YozB (DUF420 family)